MFAFGFLGLMNLQMMNLIGEELLELQKIVGLGGNGKYNEALFRKLKFLAVFFFFFFSLVSMIDMPLLISFCESGTLL